MSYIVNVITTSVYCTIMFYESKLKLWQHFQICISVSQSWTRLRSRREHLYRVYLPLITRISHESFTLPLLFLPVKLIWCANSGVSIRWYTSRAIPSAVLPPIRASVAICKQIAIYSIKLNSCNTLLCKCFTANISNEILRNISQKCR